MDFLKRKSTAMVLMILLIVAGIWIGSYRPLSNMVRETEAAFYEGEKKDGYGIQGDLDDRSSFAYNMTLVAKRYLDANDPLITGVDDARNALSKAGTPSEKYASNDALSESVAALYERLKTVELSEKDAKYPQNIYTDFLARQDIINRNSYNQLVEKCNQELSAFPANILRTVTFVKPAEYYR